MIRGNKTRKRELWTSVHEAERLAQLTFDLDNALERYRKELIRASKEQPAELRDEWLHRAELVERFRGVSVADCQRFTADMTRRVGDAGAL